MITSMFETFNVNSLYICNPAMLTLFSAGLTTGVVVESGDGITQTFGVCEGQMPPEAN